MLQLRHPCSSHTSCRPALPPRPAGASFPYHKGGAVKYEAQEVRAFGLMLADMVQRLEIEFKGELNRRAGARAQMQAAGAAT